LFVYIWAGLSFEGVKKCMGNPEADADNPVLKAQQEAQVNNILYLDYQFE